MICPQCRAENPDSALHCVQCGAGFRRSDPGETLTPAAAPFSLGGETVVASGAAGAAAVARPATAIGVLTPTPTPSSGSSSSGLSGFTLALQPGSDFGPRYRIESLLGEGGMGTVYKAYDKELDRVVAIKLLRTGAMVDPAALQRFKQELLLASKISHKNILRIHDLGDVEGVKFISMAFIEGEDLHAVLKREGRLRLDRTLKMARQLCGALEAAHAEGVVHRDLKPHNVLLDRNDSVYVSDFGLAKSLEAGAVGMTRTGDFLGTPRYMSPEQVEGKHVDARSDLYSLGLILYEMATGDVPFTGDSTLQVMYARVKQKPKNPKAVNPDLPEYLCRVILRCLETDPALRYQSAVEILADLDAERAPAVSGSRTVQIALPVAGKRLWLGLAGVVAVLLVVLLAIPGVRNAILHRGAGGARLSNGVPALSEGKFLAVIPFRVLGDPNQLNYIAEGLGEGLSAKFFQMRDVRLASASAIDKLNKKASVPEMARELGANLVVHGMVRGGADGIRIVVNLEDVADAKTLRQKEFSGVPGDLLTLEDQIYNELSAALDLKPSSEELARSTTRPTENIEAYDLYLKGRNAGRNTTDPGSIDTAIRFYEDALKKDTGFALAYTGVADASLAMYRMKKDTFWAEKALAAAQQAKRLNENLPEVRFVLGSVYNASGKTVEAIAELKRALELAPNSDEGFRRLGAAYLAIGRKAEAIQAYQRAIEINPYFWLNKNDLGYAYFRIGEFDKALAAFKQVTELEPNNPTGYVNAGAVYFRLGKYDEAIPFFQKCIQLRPSYDAYSNLGTIYFYQKRYNESVPMFEKAVEMNPNQQVAVGNLADAYRWAGQKDKAIATYDNAIALAYKELQVNPRSASTMGFLAMYYAKKGEPARGVDFIRKARAIDPSDVSLMYNEAQIQAIAGKSKESLRALRDAFQKGYPPAEAVNDPELKAVQALPEFGALVREFTRKAG